MVRPISKIKENEPPVVLYVSDDTGYVNTVRRNLGQAGFSVVTTRSPADAVELVIESPFDAVLSDYDLLQMDAVTLFEQMWNLIGESVPPTLVIMEQDAAALKKRCLSAGIKAHHAKSESAELLVERVTTILRNEKKRDLITMAASRRRFKGGTDPLTQVATKEHFGRRLKGESIAAYRDQTHLSLLVIAVDDFARIAERIGQIKADGALSQTARIIEGDLRSRDCVARYAEHTFAVALPGTKLQSAAAVGRRLRRRIASTEFGDLEQPISFTVSIGVANRPPGTQTTPDKLVEQAAHASTASQKMGGDRVVADTALTGSPLVLVLGDPSGEIGVIATKLEECNVEVRLTTSFEEARDLFDQVPVAMVMAESGMSGDEAGLGLLTWVRDRYPEIRRVLTSAHVNPEIISTAVNRAAIHYFIPTPYNLGELPMVVDELLFS
ncbi:MAG: diguanylate cyclase [Deltaproteobacteria bacterium]|nr:diguanylate cyclase [Deltaproteobacteria bacterium]